ncbi:uncharacterized protein LOC117779747 [Drosophila innubila]|uniref:uncharacterized protein LOC117779747 n=1 Tax=Drosophila innubila TaxID=198719 RepID=UPI00148DFF81|nr:uncharacterized protein LOC117779747 [Drosophila innubila]
MQLPAPATGHSMLMGLLLLLVGLAAAVPASVLAQNTELSTNANNKQQQQQQQFQQRELPAVSRITNKSKTFGGFSKVPTADKKSSPEIVPASFSNSPPARSIPNEQPQPQQQQQPQAGLYALPSNDEILAAVAAAASSSQQQLQSDPTALEEAVASSTMRKRGINYEYNPYMTVTGNDFGSDVPSGIWADDYEPTAPVNYNYNNEREVQDTDEYVPERHVNSATGSRNKAYDNLQNLLNAEAYLESIPLSVPLNYANRNYNLDERNKRGIYYNLANNGAYSAPAENTNLNKYRRFGDMRLKRDTTKLTPADMLALVALVEAGERARQETDVDAGVSLPLVDTEDVSYVHAGSWLDAPTPQQQTPSLVDYYGIPVEAQVVPKYEYVPRPQKYIGRNSRFGSSKRFMVAKKKRSVNQSQFINEPVGERGPNYYGEKFF